MLGERDADGEDAARDHVTTRATINVAGETLQVMLKFYVFLQRYCDTLQWTSSAERTIAYDEFQIYFLVHEFFYEY